MADVGGTHARFAICGTEDTTLQRIHTFRCDDHRDLESAIRAFLDDERIEGLARVCLAVAGPVDRDRIDFPNRTWSFRRSDLERDLGVEVTVLNDFSAEALALDALGPGDVHWLGRPRPTEGGTRAILGPGTGLGVATRIGSGRVVPSEGGHIGFAPVNDHEIEILRRMFPRFPRVSFERLLSGPGLENLYRANRDILPGTESSPADCSAEEISELAASGEPVGLRSVHDFLDILASFAGDVALFTWATGGVYLSGGVLRRLACFLDERRFRSRFSDKGRFAGFCETLPIALVTHEHPGLLGCAVAAQRPRAAPDGNGLHPA